MLKSLELKFPPAALFLALVIVTGLNRYDLVAFPYFFQGLASFIFMSLGVFTCVSGVWSFKIHHTTVDPTHPDKASHLVTTGIYQYSRNPMYLGFVLFQLGWAIWCSSFTGLVLAITLAVYLNRFQIVPEERVIGRLFGMAYTDYCNKTRRWLGKKVNE